MNLFKKIVVMAFLGSLGAGLGALAGETLFKAEPKPQRNPRDICLLFDVSGSMNEVIHRRDGQGVHSQLDALQEAAKDFLLRQDLQLDAMGLAVFSSGSYVVSDLSHDADALQRSIDGLSAHGGTNLGRGLEVAKGMLNRVDRERWILLFSDGKPGNFSTHQSAETQALNEAEKVRQAGIQIVAIGTGLADESLLARVTGSPQQVIISDPNALDDAFRKSEEVINNQLMLATNATVEDFMSSVLWTGIWAALIAVGAALGLVVGTNLHLHRRFLRFGEILIVLVGGVITGLLAGSAGQSAFYLLSEVEDVDVIRRCVSWVLLGLGIGYGMGFFVPNLPRKRAAIAAGLGGAVAAFCFLTLTPLVGESLAMQQPQADSIGRILGAAILGLSAGLAIVLVEAICPEARLIVHWNDKERSTLALGSTPILVGSSLEAHVLLAMEDSPVPVVARILETEKGPRLVDGETGSERTLSDGDMLTYGRIKIEVRAPAGSASAGAGTGTAAATKAKKPKKARKAEKAKRAEKAEPAAQQSPATKTRPAEQPVAEQVEAEPPEAAEQPPAPEPATPEPAAPEPAAEEQPDESPADEKPPVSSGASTWFKDHV